MVNTSTARIDAVMIFFMASDPSRVATVLIEKVLIRGGFGKRVQKTERVTWRIR